MRAFSFFLILVVLIGSTSTLVADDLGAALERELAAMECPGALVGIVTGSQPAEVFAVGVADVDEKLPMRRDFQMRIASVTKPILGTAILLLADEGKLSLDDPISKYVAGVPKGDQITLRQLGNNTSGLFNSIENKEFQAKIIADPHRPFPANEILAAAFAKPSYNDPGAAWRYSNTNAVLLGEVIDRVTGQPHADFIRERVLAPLGMTKTDFNEKDALPAPSPHGYRNGYENKWLGYGQTFYDVTDYSAAWTGAAGNMRSTVDDLLLAGKRLAAGSLLSDTSREEFHRWVATTRPELEYGFCLGKSKDWIGHTGDVPGFASFLGYLPDADTTLVVLTNLSNNKDGSSPAERLRDVVIRERKLSAEQP